MSIVIYGGHDRMERIYIDEAKKVGLKAKVYTYGRNDIRKSIGKSDGILIFTDTISHKVASTISKEAKKKNIPIIVCHNSSKTSYKNTIKEFVS
ncbi:DUF2325 domain-containing protein [Tepidibacter formicigenes]|jgi:hypothetical protein|uniref:DUF2325 domain-containing protein n=1 Tax=Tepidibacter formicigenes DSM 15518 TaxID=1123349 RepID=A0A1M6S5G4_9FIRM|nr:DUF2325 domain-containing protein [Tepidibacter formicigenes]SHK39963.1 hypothetical protein SAMN02744037_02260 [Tepidibacter formicigenes DSM 15518]